MKKIFTILIAVILWSSCTSDDSSSGRVQIRVYNASDYNFENVYMNTGTGDKPYGDIVSGTYSSYKIQNIAYSNPDVELVIDGETYTISNENVEEVEPLSSGNYTFEIYATDEATPDRLSFQLVEEEEEF
ncbi:hypothetical protein SAMN05216480_101754 [Pustulibacterium marinum]|uniref:Uncharacterized protein n=1 Tax=Pustulibacterium marinum TaxID=1224947 RepID=A0A1I7F8W9_9FLAO|nr:hypothetical protein [Pustulibacterium marinum]SFU32673.1 hypothetical protein SAMN05216480_101754 [Pustulibacterium marinum]